MTSEQAMKLLALKFKSGNGIPVTRAAITLEEYEAIRQAINEEREACAKMCDAIESQWKRYGNGHANGAMDCAKAIRNREPA